MHPNTRSERLHHFDLLRLFLVMLALMSHLLLAQRFSRPDLVTAVIRSATPALLIVFGFMMEHVYARRWAISGPGIILERMLTRAVLCYLAFAAIVLVVFLGGRASALQFFGAIIFAMPGFPYADIFKYYALVIPVVFFLMWVRFTFGRRWKLVVAVFLLAVAELTQAFTYFFDGPLPYMGSLFLGLQDTAGPSIVHCLILVLFGELVASYKSGSGGTLERNILAGLAALSFAAVAAEIARLGFPLFLKGIARYSGYRAHNSYIYFAYGILAFMFYWGLSWLAVLRLKHSLRQKLTYYGGNTFIIFFYGNVIILLLPGIRHDVVSLVLACGTVAVLSLASVDVFGWAKGRFAFIPAFNRLLGLGVHNLVHGLHLALHTSGARKQASIPLQAKANPKEKELANL